MKKIMILLIILMILLLGFISLSCRKSDIMKQSYNSPEVKAGQMTVCPVMGTKFIVKDDTQFVVIKDKKYYICCPSCIDKLKNEPDKYLKD